MESNPFLISGYISPKYFCDRVAEAETVTEALTSKRHLTLFSPRRIGKTGLIHHVFYLGSREKLFIPVYADIMATTSLQEFVETLGKAVFTAVARNETALKKILKKLSLLRPKITIDEFTGAPSVTFSVSSGQEAVNSLEVIFQYFNSQNSQFVLAVDEFQQITEYPEKNVEALLRSFVQQSSNVTVLFSGSRKHILTGIFTAPERPFYNSTQILELGKISSESYLDFIRERFSSESRSITSSSVSLILDVTSLHTFYVQFLCNRIYSAFRKVDSDQVRAMLLKIINENEPVYGGYINLITTLQFRVLRAIALNDGVRNPTSSEFLDRHNLGAASSVSLAVKSLEDKGFISCNDQVYNLNDQFFRQWLIYKSG
jgi:uncharacterized protein